MTTPFFANRAWELVETAGEDVLVPRETILGEINITVSQFERIKSYIRDHITMEKGKAFLAYRGAYTITTDPAKIAENVGGRLARINKELTRLLSGAINPLGDDVGHYEVLVMYQQEIEHMMRTAERVEKTTLRLPPPVKVTANRRRRRRPETS
jgi:hypothetical protein